MMPVRKTSFAKPPQIHIANNIFIITFSNNDLMKERL